MSKISEISKKYKAEVENAKNAEFSTRYGSHYNTVVVPHLKELDDKFNKMVTETKQKLDSEKQEYVAAQQKMIRDEIDAEYTAVLSTIDSFIEKEG
jgi:hypothetical protein